MNIEQITLKDIVSMETIGFSKKAARVQKGNTSEEELRARKIIRDPGIGKVIFAAKPDGLNEATLVMMAISYDASETYLADSFSLSIARRPRCLEVQQIFKELFSRKNLDALYVPEMIRDTSQTNVIQAYNEFLGYKTKKLDEKSLVEYLGLLGSWTKTVDSFSIKDYLP